MHATASEVFVSASAVGQKSKPNDMKPFEVIFRGI